MQTKHQKKEEINEHHQQQEVVGEHKKKQTITNPNKAKTKKIIFFFFLGGVYNTLSHQAGEVFLCIGGGDYNIWA
ncbi:hypothetical protein [Acinetobacter baumannii]